MKPTDPKLYVLKYQSSRDLCKFIGLKNLCKNIHYFSKMVYILYQKNGCFIILQSFFLTLITLSTGLLLYVLNLLSIHQSTYAREDAYPWWGRKGAGANLQESAGERWGTP